MIAMNAISTASALVDVDSWSRTSSLPGWKRDRIVWAETCVKPELGLEVVEGVFAAGWQLLSETSELCAMLFLSERGQIQISFGKADKICGSGAEGCRAVLVLLDVNQFGRTDVCPETDWIATCMGSQQMAHTCVQDKLSRALINHLRSILRRTSEKASSHRVIRRLVNQLFRRISLLHTKRASRSSIVENVVTKMSQRAYRQTGRDEWARIAGLSEAHLSRLFKRETGQSMRRYCLQTRLDNARQILEADSEVSVKSVGRQCGFESESCFHTNFRKFFGMTPGEYREALLYL